MKRDLIKLNKFCFVLAGILFLAVSALAQVSLRKALDFDLDGKADYTIFRPSTNVWWTLKTSNSTWQTYQFTGISLYTHDHFTPGDYDGDSKAEYAFWRNSNNTWYRYQSSNSTVVSTAFGAPGDEPVARDYDGDGKTDLAFVRRVTGSPNGTLTWNIQRSSNTSIVDVVQFGWDTDFPVPGDYDGDGKFDIAVQRPGADYRTQTVFYVLLSSNGTTQVTSFGIAGDRAVPGDYDGDGKTDIAVVRDGVNSSANLVWHIQQSTAGYRVDTFGLTGTDKTAQADYDGDGKTDPTVWRETNGTFYVLKSTGGTGGAAWGTYGDIPIASYDNH
jgi:hypothetical protein